MPRGRTAKALRALRKKYGLGEFKRSNKRRKSKRRAVGHRMSNTSRKPSWRPW